MRVLLILGLAGSFVSASAAAQVSAPTSPAIFHVTRPLWTRVPTSGDVEAARPPRADAHGGVRFNCVVQADGTLDDCVVVQEDPKGLGLGEAALRLVPKLKMRSKDANGAPTAGGVITIPIRF